MSNADWAWYTADRTKWSGPAPATTTAHPEAADLVQTIPLGQGDGLRARLDPERDPIARAICEQLGIDWRTILEQDEVDP